MYQYVSLGVFREVTLKNKRVLEVNAGFGGGLAFLAMNFLPNQAIGIEPNASFVERAREKFCDVDNCFFQQGCFEDLVKSGEIEEESFDIVLAVESLHKMKNWHDSFT